MATKTFKDSDVENMSEEELDAELESLNSNGQDEPQKSIDEMTEEELDNELSSLSKESESESEKKPVELSLPEKAADFLSGGIVSKGKEIQQRALSGEEGEEAKIFAEGQKQLQGDLKIGGQIGQSLLSGGMAGKVLATIPQLQKAKVIQGLVSSAQTKLANSGIRMSNTIKDAVKLSVEGAVAVQPFDYENIGDRIKATSIASVISPALGLSFKAGMQIASQAGRQINKFKTSLKSSVKETSVGTLRDPRIPSITRVRESLQEAERSGNEIGRSAARQQSENIKRAGGAQQAIDERTSRIKEVIQSSIKSEESGVRASLKEATRQINKSIDDTEKLLNVESDIAAQSYGEKVSGFFRRNSSIYGKELDTISDQIATTGRMTLGEADDVLSQAIRRSSSEAEVDSGSILDQMKGLLQRKYGVEVKDGAGNIISRDPGELIDFKDFLADVRKIWGQSFKGSGRMTQDDIPGAILKSEFGELVSRLPGGESFKGLQSAYRPVISYMNKANSIIQPYKGEAYRKGAYELVKRVAKNDGVAPVEKDIVDFIEYGTERFAKGIGSVSARARQLGENMKVLSDELGKQGLQAEKRLIDIAKEGAIKMSRINVMSQGASKRITDEANRRTALIMEEAALAQSKLWSRAKQLRGREFVVGDINRRNQVIKNLGVGLVTSVGGITGAYVVLRGARQLVNVIGNEE